MARKIDFRHCLNFILLCLLFVGLFICFDFVQAEAALNVKMKDGHILIKTTDIAASSNTRYVTDGWYIHKKPKLGQPTQDEFGFIDRITQTGEDPSPPVPGKMLLSYFDVLEEDVRHALISADAAYIQEGDVFFMSARFRIQEGNDLLPERYESLAEIRNARNWANPDDFQQYYDIKVNFFGDVYPALHVLQTSRGQFMREIEIGNFRAGEQVVELLKYEFDYGGQSYRLQKSCFSSLEQPKMYKFCETADTLKRSATMPLGGLQVLAFYEPISTGFADGEFGSNKPDKQLFDVNRAIPAGESIFMRVSADPYLYRYFFQEHKGNQSVQVKLVRNVIRTREQLEDGEYVKRSTVTEESRMHTQSMSYLYWTIEQFEVFQLKRGAIFSSMLPGGKLSFSSDEYLSVKTDLPKISLLRHVQHVKQDEQPAIRLPDLHLNLGRNSFDTLYEFFSQKELLAIQKQINPLLVRNDRLALNGNLIVDDRWSASETPAPQKIETQNIHDRINLVKTDIRIPVQTRNAIYGSVGSVVYRKLTETGESTEETAVPISNLNKITIHTPLSIDSKLSIDKKIVQLLHPVENVNYLVTGMPFQLTIHHAGNHISEKGYGFSDYKKYVASIQMFATFDVLFNDKLLKRNSWHDLPKTAMSVSFRLPEWVPEGKHLMKIRSRPAGCLQNICTAQANVNLLQQNEAVEEMNPLTVIGRLYSFHINEIDLTNQKISAEFGAGRAKPYDLPVRYLEDKKIPGNRSLIELGAKIAYSLRTNGDYKDANDGILLKFSYDFIDRNGEKRREVDLYLKNQNKNLVRLNSSADLRRHTLKPLENLFKNKQVSKIKNSNQISIGNDYHQWIPAALRRFVDDVGSVQQWYGVFGLPKNVLVADKSSDLRAYARTQRLRVDSPLFLRNGFLIVNVRIFTVRDGHIEQPILSYGKTRYANQWLNEQLREFVTLNGRKIIVQPGDVLIYDLQSHTHQKFTSYIVN